MPKNLVIVESPAKAKTIEGFLGPDFLVKSSFGHVRDLSKKQLSVDVSNDFEPAYEISPDKTQVVKELKKLAKEAEVIWLASDEDREGEAISWHLVEALKLTKSKIKRIVFHEITKEAILKAIDTPRGIDYNLVNAQQARRVLDRLVGYEISPILWKKIKPALSAGRVQSVAVRLIVEREDEIKNFNIEANYRLTAQFVLPDNTTILQAELPKRFKTFEEAENFLLKCKDAQYSIGDIETKPGKKSPAPPFTTSTLQQEASRKLGFSVSKTMMVAQQLYESGKITYMRTDSVNLSDLAVNTAKAHIIETYGNVYSNPRQYTTKTKGAQEAHEAIRPTYLNQTNIDGDASQKRLYELIWKRTIASQMANAVLEKTTVTIDLSTTSERMVAKGEVISFDGFLKVYMESSDDEENKSSDTVLPKVSIGDILSLNQMDAIERFSQHPPRYTEASLVKKLEELGIGRPSTYAPTISTIQKREYVVKEDRDGVIRSYQHLILKNKELVKEILSENTGFEKNKLFPTDIGTLVNNFLVQYFTNILDYNFTASVEKEFDEIAQGDRLWNEMLKEFYNPFHKQVEETIQNSERQTGERLLGSDPKTGKNIYVKLGRYGAIVQLGETEDEEKPKFAGLRKGQSIETVDLNDALELFKFPRSIGQYEENELTVAIGRFGPYVKHNGAFFSLQKTDDPATISEERAIELIEAKRKADKEKFIKSFDEEPEIQILNGRYGPYISFKKKNYKIPKDSDPHALSLDECKEIIAHAAKTPKKTRKPRKKSS